MATSGEPGANLNQAALAAREIMRRGHVAYVPHLGWILDAIAPVPREAWLRCDQAWLEVCDAVLRLPGESAGADAECEFAREWGIPVYDELAELLMSALR